MPDTTPTSSTGWFSDMQRCSSAATLADGRDVAALQDLREHPHRDVAEAVLPALLLAQPGLGVGRQFARHADAGEEQRAPALHPAAIGEIEILGDGVALPAAAGIDRRALPDAAGAVEGQRMAGPAARRLLDAEMGVERHHLHLGERVLVRIEEVEARLDEGGLRLGEERPHADAQEVDRRHVVDVEDREEVVRRLLHRLVQRAALVAAAVRALQRHDVEALGAQLGRHLRAPSRPSRRCCRRAAGCAACRAASRARAADSAPRRTTAPSLKDGICTTTCGRSASAGSGVASSASSRARPCGLQAMMQHHHVEQAADEGGQQHAADREHGAEEQSEGGEDGHRCCLQVPVLGVRLNSVFLPRPAPTIAPALATAR